MSDFNTLPRNNGIKVYAIESNGDILQTSSRRDLYKISLFSGTGFVRYGDRTYAISSPVLMLTEPGATYEWRFETNDIPSYTCVLNRQFLEMHCVRWFNHTNFFSSANPQLYHLDVREARFIDSIFHKMVSAQNSVYTFKCELIRDQILVLLHTALSMKHSENYDDSMPALKPVSRHVEFVEMQLPLQAQELHFN
jgi:AraC family transcriptional regulator, transcriptional activator of pobA